MQRLQQFYFDFVFVAKIFAVRIFLILGAYFLCVEP
jgi:hypothetical protein